MNADPEKSATPRPSMRREIFSMFGEGGFGKGLLALLLLAGAGFAMHISAQGNDVTVQFVGGLMIFMVVLGALAALLSSFKLATYHEAFGLPPGTIRALLAIGLLVIFVVFGIDQVNRLSEKTSGVGEFLHTVTVPQRDLDAALLRYERTGLLTVVQVNPAVAGAEGTAELHLYTRHDLSAATDLSKQLLTMISTLLTTIIGFYFGSRSSSEAAATAHASPGRAAALSAAVLREAEELQGGLDNAVKDAGPLMALVEQIRAKPVDAARKDEVDPLQKAADDLVVAYRTLQAEIAGDLEAARTAAQAAAVASSEAEGKLGVERANAALREARPKIQRLDEMKPVIEQAAKALQTATAEG